MAGAAQALTYTLRPISASGAHTIVGNEIRLQGGGQRVRLEIRISNWAPDEVKTWQSTIDCAGDPGAMPPEGYNSGINGPLVPAFVACNSDAVCAAAFGDDDARCGRICNGGANDDLPCQSDPGCPGGTCVFDHCQAGFQDDERADWIFAGITAISAVNTFTCDYAYGSTTLGANAIDNGTQKYGGTLLLDVPANAAGTFTIDFINDLSSTFYINQNKETLPANRVVGMITVLCTNAAQCNDKVCSGGGDAGTPCGVNADCDSNVCTNNLCTSDTCNGQGQCINTPNFNQALFCCNPANGVLTDLSDNNACTADTCNAGTPVHTPTPGATCGSPANTQCDNPDTCDANAVCQPNFEANGFGCGNPANSACDLADTCNGSGTCQTNVQPAGAACGSNFDGPCDDPDTCNGLGTCLTNQVANNTPCDDSFFCTVGETCSNGACTNSSPRNCADSLTCTTDTCNEGSNMCVNTQDPNTCLVDNACYAEGALNPANTCEICDSAANPIDWTVQPDGSACIDGNACTTGDMCTGGSCAGVVDPNCNANCASAVEAIEGQNSSNNQSGGADDGEASCQPNSNSDVWWFYTALCDGLIFISTTGSNLMPNNDAVLNVYTDCPGDGGTEIACDDDSGIDENAALIFPALTGNTYLIRLAGFENNTGNVILNLRPFDDCVIDGVCYSEDDRNPENPCQACIPDVSTTEWTNLVEGTLCDPNPNAEDTECDGPDTCDGAGSCENNNKPDGTLCSDEMPANVCTENLCAGGNCTHPPEPAGLPCGSPANTDCDNPDTCDGGGACVPNFEAPGFQCGDQTVTECDNGDICDAVGNCLDNLDPNGTDCDDFDVCTDDEFCFNGLCIGVGIPEAPIVEGYGARNLMVTPQPANSAAPVALRLTSPTWTCLDLYIQADGTLGPTPVIQLPADWDTILVSGPELYPSSKFLPSTYEVVAECGAFASPPGSDDMWLWGDLDNDNDVDFMDISLIVNEWRLSVSFLNPDPLFDTYPCPPDNKLDFRDIAEITEAFRGIDYACPTPCP